MSPDKPRTLLEAEMQAAGLSSRGLAKKLAGSDEMRQIDKERTNVRRWLDPDKGISDASAARLGRVFGKPADYFVREPKPRPRQADRLEVLVAEVAELTKTQRGLVTRLTDTRTRLKRLEDALSHTPTGSTRQEEQSG